MSKKTVVIVSAISFVLSTLFCWQGLEKGTLPSFSLQEDELGKLCVSQVYPAMSKENKTETTKETEATTENEERERKVTSEKKVEKKTKKTVSKKKPQVIIYHTHGSESYQPYSKSNFHTTKEEGSVREVAAVMTKELQDKGIGVVHDKTIHDRESFNQSYDRSLETVTALQKKYPSAKYIIDLHRDAAAYSGNVGKTVKIKGEKVATYSLVVGRNNDNFDQLMSFAKKVNGKAASLYPGFEGRIIEKTYRYNEYISDNYILLEIGNNQNDIKDVKATGKYFAHVMEAVIED